MRFCGQIVRKSTQTGLTAIGLIWEEGVQTSMLHMVITFSFTFHPRIRQACVEISYKGSNSRQPCIPIHNISTMPSSHSKHFSHLFPPSSAFPTLTTTILEIETCFGETSQNLISKPGTCNWCGSQRRWWEMHKCRICAAKFKFQGKWQWRLWWFLIEQRWPLVKVETHQMKMLKKTLPRMWQKLRHLTV